MKDINSFATVPDAISYYTKIIAECGRNRDYSHHDEILNFKLQLRERILLESIKL